MDQLHASGREGQLTESTASILLAVLPKLLLVFGLILVFLTPPIQSADEDSHFIRSVMVAEGNLGTRQDNGRWGQDVPVSLVQYVESYRPMFFDSSVRFSYDRWYQESYQPADWETEGFHSYSAQSLSPLYYIPQAAGITVGRVIYFIAPSDLNWAGALYFARIGNLIAYILVFMAAIRAAPKFALMLGFIAANPMTISLAASCSYDVTVILSAVTFFAAVMKAVEKNGDVPWAHYLLILGLAFALGHSKAVYAPVMLSLFMLWKPLGFTNFAKLASAAGAAAIFGMFLSSAVFGLPLDPPLQAAIDAQVAHVKGNVFSVPGLLAASVEKNAGNLFVGMLGNLGWLSARLPLPFLVAWFGVGIAAVIADGLSARHSRPWAGAGLMLGGAAIATVGLFVAMYIVWSSLTEGIGAPTIDSVQGRYLLPILPFVMAAGVLAVSALLQPRPKIAEAVARMQITLTTVALSVVVFMIVFRYWIPV